MQLFQTCATSVPNHATSVDVIKQRQALSNSKQKAQTAASQQFCNLIFFSNIRQQLSVHQKDVTMVKTVHKIDPNPDTVIILKNSLSDFAVWDLPDVANLGDITPTPTDDLVSIKDVTPESIAVSDNIWGFSYRSKLKGKKGKKAGMARKRYSQSEIQGTEPGLDQEILQEVGFATVSGQKKEEIANLDAVRNVTTTVASHKVDIEVTDGPSSSLPGSLFGSGVAEKLTESHAAMSSGVDSELNAGSQAERSIEASPGSSSITLSEEMPVPSPADEEGTHYHVSSRHLILASKHFRRMMSNEKWMEGIRQEDGLFYMRPDGWDASVFLILLNVLHLRNRSVPRVIDLETMAKVAVLADFYKCEEAVEICATMWIEDLKTKQPIPTSYCRDLMLWMCVARVFGLSREFKQTTAIALFHSKESICTLGLPIWPTIAGKCP